ncbi:hypothetical protein FQN54_002120 [Arachnomyces sp. PD_36]|nr:hypothetical protein FQN54_002120 [Arachnomyces sp. PD_36]
MNIYRNVPGFKPSSKATPTTLCQKCLKKDIYECKASAQERPYTSRPSRTQQLQNPRLVPKLTSDVPNDLARTKGVADEELAKRERERGLKREMEDDDDISGGPGNSAKRARSVSSYSSGSVSTISTDRSRSQSPKRRRYDTRASASPHGRDSPSPAPRSPARKRRYSDSSSEYSYSSRSPIGRRHSRSREPDRNTRRRRNDRSPDERGRSYNSDRRGSWRARSRSGSMDKSRIARERRSLTPAMAAQGRNYPEDRHDSSAGDRRRPRDQSRGRHENRHPERRGADDRQPRQPPPPPKERSLSPFSKRLALTQAMNMGR